MRNPHQSVFSNLSNHSDHSEHWYLATTKPRQEIRAVENLNNQDIQAFCPIVNVEKLLRGKKKIVAEALFTGYIFINISTESPLWYKVRSTRGVRDWVRFSGNVAKIKDELVTDFKELNNKSEQQVVFSRFNLGQSVRILSGPFRGLKAIYDRDDGEMRSMILLEFLGQTNRLSIDDHQITSE